MFTKITKTIIDYDEYINAFSHIYSITSVSKYKSFQYKILTNSVLLNNRLVKGKLVTSALCDFCQSAKENYYHFFWDCRVTRRFWEQVKNFIQNIHVSHLNWSNRTVFLNDIMSPITHIPNLFVLVAKQHLCRCKCLKEIPNIQVFESEISFIPEAEKVQAMTRGIGAKIRFNQRWNESLDIQSLDFDE